MNSHLSRPTVTSKLKRPTYGMGTGSPLLKSLLGLAPDGVYIADWLPEPLVSSYLTFPPLPTEAGGISLLHLPWSRLHQTLSGIFALRSSDFPRTPLGCSRLFNLLTLLFFQPFDNIIIKSHCQNFVLSKIVLNSLYFQDFQKLK